MRDQHDDNETRQASEQPSNRQAEELSQRHAALDPEVDEPQICRGID